MEATKLLLKGREGNDTPIPVPGNKTMILTVTYTNRKHANQLSEQGVPLITDKSMDESRTKALVKKNLFSARRGGNAVRRIELKAAGTKIDATGISMKIPDKVSVNGLELFGKLAEIAKQRGISDVYLRTRERATEVRLARQEDWRGAKLTTKIYFIPEGEVDAKVKKGTGSKKFSLAEAEKVLSDLISPTWFIHGWDNPDSFVFNLTYRQPDKDPTHQVVI